MESLEGWAEVDSLEDWLDQAKSEAGFDDWAGLEVEMETLSNEGVFLAKNPVLGSRAISSNCAAVRLRTEGEFDARRISKSVTRTRRIHWLSRGWWVEFDVATLRELEEIFLLFRGCPDVEFIELIDYKPTASKYARTVDQEGLEAAQDSAASKGCAAGIRTANQKQWAETQIDGLWNRVQHCGEGQTVAVIDAGFLADDPHLAGKDLAMCAVFGGCYPGYKVGKEYLRSWSSDANEHGTICAGLVGARPTDDGKIGVARKVRLGLLRLRETNVTSPFHMAQALAFACFPEREVPSSNLAQVVTFSLAAEGRTRSPTLDIVQRWCRNRVRGQGGAVLCFASLYENHKHRRDDSWSNADGVLSIGSWAHDITDGGPVKAKGFRGIDMMAPNYCSTVLGSGYGTSVSTPLVAGTAALILAELPHLTLDDLRQALLEGADPMPTNHTCEDHGAGMLNALTSFHIAKDPTTPGPKKPTC